MMPADGALAGTCDLHIREGQVTQGSERPSVGIEALGLAGTGGTAG